MKSEAIGGYFSWSAPRTGIEHPVAPAVAFRSARSALAAHLRHMGVRRLWLPHYICGAVIDALRAADVVPVTYALDETWGVSTDVVLSGDEWLLCVDYLGISDQAIRAALDRFPSTRVIVDASQAFYRRRIADETLLFSPRKFFAVPDGGWIESSHVTPAPTVRDEEASRERTTYLHERAAGRIEAGYAAYQTAEASLTSPAPVSLSALTRELLSGQDLLGVSATRRRNYCFIQRRLEVLGIAAPPLPDGATPLFVPASVPDAGPVRTALAAGGIFSPAFWPDAFPPANDPVGRRLKKDTVFLPCDQRYGEVEMGRVADELARHLEQRGGSSTGTVL